MVTRRDQAKSSEEIRRAIRAGEYVSSAGAAVSVKKYLTSLIETKIAEYGDEGFPEVHSSLEGLLSGPFREAALDAAKGVMDEYTNAGWRVIFSWDAKEIYFRLE